MTLLLLIHQHWPNRPTAIVNTNMKPAMMKILSMLATSIAFARAVEVRYDPVSLDLPCAKFANNRKGYDNASRSMNAVACSDGENGLITRYGWEEQGQIPGFPHIAASSTVASWNSPNCGQCLRVSYGGRALSILAVDHADVGLVVSQKTMDFLARNQSVAKGVIDMKVQLVTLDDCGID